MSLGGWGWGLGGVAESLSRPGRSGRGAAPTEPDFHPIDRISILLGTRFAPSSKLRFLLIPTMSCGLFRFQRDIAAVRV